MAIGVVAGIVLAAILALIGLFKLMWRVAEPNEALVISGSTHRTEGIGEGMGFRIVTGRGTLVVPGVQAVRKLSLDLNETQLNVDCVTHQGIPLRVKGVVIFKIGDDLVSIANAARRFLDQQKMMPERVHIVFIGHLRSIVGGLTVEDMIRDREKLTGQTRAACGTEMEKLGLIVDSLQIHEIEDPTGYIKNLAMPHAAAVQRDARIAQAEANRLATEAEQTAFARMAEATRDSEILQAGLPGRTRQGRGDRPPGGPALGGGGPPGGRRTGDAGRRARGAPARAAAPGRRTQARGRGGVRDPHPRRGRARRPHLGGAGQGQGDGAGGRRRGHARDDGGDRGRGGHRGAGARGREGHPGDR